MYLYYLFVDYLYNIYPIIDDVPQHAHTWIVTRVHIIYIYIYVYTSTYLCMIVCNIFVYRFSYDFKPDGKPKTGTSLNTRVTKQSCQEMARGLDRPTGNRSLGRFQVDLSARMPGTTCRRGPHRLTMNIHRITILFNEYNGYQY